MVPVPKKVKYQIQILDAIIFSILILSNNQKGDTSYNKLYRHVVDKVDKKISKRDFQSHLTYLIQDGMIVKESIKKDSKKTLPTSSYSLTIKGKKIDSLNLTGADYEDSRSKKKKLYMLLLVFELFKRRSLFSERQLRHFLKGFEISIDKLEIIDNKDLNQNKNPESFLFSEDMTLYKSYNDIEVLKFKNSDNKIYYYVVFPGFSADEFKFYIELIEKGKEPRPFTEERTSIEIPVISYQDFSLEEIQDAINMLRQNEIIKPIKSIIPGEMRYDVKNNDLKELFRNLWLLHIIDFHLVINRLTYSYKGLFGNDIKFLTFYYGQKDAGKILAYFHDYRKKYRKDLIGENNNSKDLKDLEGQRKDLAEQIQSFYKEISTKNENDFMVSLIKDICLPINGIT